MNKIGKIVELKIDWEDESIEDVGVDIMSLVDSPAIGIGWQAFAQEVDIMDLISREDFGEVLDEHNTVYLNFTKEQFDTEQEVIEGIVGLAIAGLQDATNQGEIKYKYSGPISTRPFCAAMLLLNKVYTAEELQVMGSTIGNGIDIGPQAVTRWHGGPECRHFFEQVRVFRSRNGGPVNVINEGRVQDSNSNSPMYQAGETMQSRPNRGYKTAFTEMKFAIEEDQHIITGPAMRAGQLIPRKDEVTGEIFHVYFTAETIKKIAEKFLEQNKQNQTDINHSMVPDTDNTLIESWIVVDPEMDKSKLLGYTAKKGDWYVSYKIKNEETWQKIKDGSLTGFSVAGQFIENFKFTTETFESYNDYPESAKNAAQRALEIRDKNPDLDCGTAVGWTRANQLAKGENISEETIARMASFARHEQNSKGNPNEDCGALMWLCWGGTEGINWASNKLKEIRS